MTGFLTMWTGLSFLILDTMAGITISGSNSDRFFARGDCGEGWDGVGILYSIVVVMGVLRFSFRKHPMGTVITLMRPKSCGTGFQPVKPAEIHGLEARATNRQ
jgi:hypothetical protein